MPHRPEQKVHRNVDTDAGCSEREPDGGEHDQRGQPHGAEAEHLDGVHGEQCRGSRQHESMVQHMDQRIEHVVVSDAVPGIHRRVHRNRQQHGITHDGGAERAGELDVAAAP